MGRAWNFWTIKHDGTYNDRYSFNSDPRYKTQIWFTEGQSPRNS